MLKKFNLMREQTKLEEKWNVITHGVAVLASLIGLFVLLDKVNYTNKQHYYSLLLYGFSLCFLYTASTLYHYVSRMDLKNRLRILDHIGIYILIAGTYTPVTLITLTDSRGMLLFSLVWSLAIIGTILKLFFTGKYEIISLSLYLVMGWLIILDINTLSEVVGFEGMWYLKLGGLAYTSGIIFYAWKKLFFNHVIWHVFVMAGSLFHYIFIWKYVLTN